MSKKEAVCLLLECCGKVLAVARRGTTDQWGLPGGKVDKGETLEEALVREVREETRIVLDITFLSKVFEREDDEYKVTTFSAAITSFVVSFKGDAGPVKFVTWEELCSGPFGEYNKKLKESISFEEAYGK